MGIADRQLDKADRKRKLSRFEKKLVKYQTVVDAIITHLPNVADVFGDDENPCTGLAFRAKDTGGFTVVIKRDRGLEKEVMFSWGEDVADGFIAIDEKLSRSDWKEDLPWKPEALGPTKKKK